MTDPELDPMSTPAIDSLEAHIGGVVVAWSRLTFLLEHLFAHLAGVSDEYVRAVLLRKIRDRILDETCDWLAARLPESDRKPVRDWLRSVGKLREERNDLLHLTMSDYQAGDDPEWRAGRMRVKPDKKTGAVSYGAEELTAADLARFREHVDALRMAFFELPKTARPVL